MNRQMCYAIIFLIFYILDFKNFCSGILVKTSFTENEYLSEDWYPLDQSVVRIVKREAVNSSDIDVRKNQSIESVDFSNTTAAPISVSNDAEEVEVDGHNASIKGVDHHIYYRSYSKQGIEEVETLWVHMNNVSVQHETLSNAHRRALTVALTFEFPFYGHILRNVTITTGGFLYTGSFLHKWLAATQYIAPLMANFDTSVSPNATVKYTDNGTSLTVQWENVKLKDSPDGGSFTFQASIHDSGKIIFAYKNVPVTVKLIKDEQHPVKVGLSDAYIVQKTIFYVRKKTIYEYHKIDLKKDGNNFSIKNWTAIVFEPLPNCVSFKTCDSCLTANTSFNCAWCQSVGRCSDGLDRYRQEWLDGKCEISAITNDSVCSVIPTTTVAAPLHEDLTGKKSSASTANHVSKGLVVSLTVLILIIGIGCWLLYAYYFPHSSSGQILIKYRPSRWSWRRGETRYTAATMHSIHM